MENMYQSDDVFRLWVDGEWHIIREPVGWDKINMVIKRDKDFHGLDFEFSDGTAVLQFTEVSGRQLILDEFKKHGNDSRIILQFCFLRNDEIIVDYEGHLDFNPYKKTSNTFECNVKRKTFDDNIETRIETPVTLTSNKTIDGSDMPDMNMVSLPLHSKAIVQTFTVDRAYDATQYFSYPFSNKSGDGSAHTYYVTPDYSTNITSEIETTGTNIFGVYEQEPVYGDKWDFDLKSAGSFRVTIKFLMRFGFYLTPRLTGRSGRILSWTFGFYLVRKRGIVLDTFNIGDPISGNEPDKRLDFTFSGSMDQDIDLMVGDKLYIYGKFNFDGDRNWNRETTELWMDITKVSLKGKTEAPSSLANTFLMHDVVDRVLQSISDKKARLKSNFLGRPDLGYPEMGCGAKQVITNGYQIRQFDIVNRPVIISMKEILESLNAFHCIGTSYELDEDGYYFRLERFDYFYRDVEIMTIEEPSNYFEETDLDIIYNEIEVGYNKFPEDDVSVLDEFNTKHSYITPIISYKKKLSILSKIIGSGYALELTRRKKFAATPVDSWKYDEDNFLITVRQNGSAWVPEKDEAFVSPVKGVISPETSYNLRRSPKRMLLAWAEFINSGLAYKKVSDIIKNTFFSKNGDLSTQFKETETCSIGDSEKDIITEKSDLFLIDNDGFKKIFSPDRITFKAKLNYDQIRFIKRCHQNQDTDGKNYGYIRVKDNDGEYQKGFLMQLDYNQNTEMCSLVLRKKYANLSSPNNCTDYADWDFSQFEAATGLSPEIEQCRFNDFN